MGPPEYTLIARRSLLAAALATPLVRAQPRPQAVASGDARDAARSRHFPFGPVVPSRRLDPWSVITHRGHVAPLAALLQGQVSALQLMFTGCSATCPIQGALFAQAQQQLVGVSGVQFVSISIDALGDTPQLLEAWLRRMGAGPHWWAAVPRVADVDRLVARLGEGGEPRPAGPDAHNGQVYLFDRRAELVLRTPSMPPVQGIVDAVREVISRG